MGEVASAQRTITIRRRRWPPFARTAAMLWFAFLVWVAVGVFPELRSRLVPKALDAVPNVATLFASLPLPGKVAVGAGGLVVLALFGWVAYCGWQFTEERRIEAAHAEDARQQHNMAAGAARAFAAPAAAMTAQGAATHEEVIAARKDIKALAGKLAADAPAIPATVVAPAGLPRPLALIGRDAELADLMDGLLQGRSVGIFALRGMGGIGKSALAAEAVARLSEDRAAFPGGAAWVSAEGLAGADGLAELWSRVARALGLEQVATLADAEARRAALARALAALPRTLLALDNLEPGLDADALIRTLAVSNHTALLLTARELLPSTALRTIELRTLADPDAQALFAQNLRQRDATRPTADDRPHIPAIVEAVGGLPLAIEQLAAFAGAQQRPLATLAADLARDGITAAAFRANPTRTLTASFDRSWDVLQPRQRRLFAGLSLLAGASFPRAAALALAPAAAATEADGDPADPELDTAALVTYALVEPLAGDRLRLHPLLREYAAARLRALGPAVESPLGDALLAYWLEYAETHPGYDGMDALEAEAPGLMGALAWAHEHERYREVLAIAHALNRFWFVRGRMDEARRARPLALEAATRLKDMDEQRWAEHELAVLNAGQGLLAEARAGFERALALARQLGDPAAEQAETHELAVLDDDAGAYDAARRGYERALQLARQLGDPSAEAAELGNFGLFLCEHDEMGRGYQMIQDALALSERLGDIYAAGKAIEFLGRADTYRGDIPAAIAHYREALRRFAHVQSPDAEDARAALRRLGVEP